MLSPDLIVLFGDSVPDRLDVVLVDVASSRLDDPILEIGKIILYRVFPLSVFDRESLLIHLRQSLP